MRRTTPAWLFKKYTSLAIGRLFPLGKATIDGLEFRYLRREGPPHDPERLSAEGLEFHQRIDKMLGDTAIDIGANIGSYSLRLARRFRRVTAFEPSPAHSRVLRLNVSLNNISNVTLEEVALSDTTGVTPLYIRGGGATSLDPSHYGLKYSSVRTVKVSKLDDYRPMFTRLDFVKIDAENSEYRILVGGKETILRFKPIIAVEVHQARLPSDESCRCDTCNLLNTLGYNVEVTGKLRTVGDVHWVWATFDNRLS